VVDQKITGGSCNNTKEDSTDWAWNLQTSVNFGNERENQNGIKQENNKFVNKK